MKTETWMKQAAEDLVVAKDNCSMGHYNVASFYSQQCAEKALKGYLLEAGHKLHKTHDLTELGAIAGMPADLLGRCDGLTLAYMETRYPDQFAKYQKEDAEGDIAIAEAVYEWVTGKIS
jgi:HEPN domain-containing protein